MYPQPNSEASILQGQDHFRLFTQLVSPGDIYESEVSALAFSVGPNSDFANYMLTYYVASAAASQANRTVGGSVGQAIISPDRSLVARLDARNDQFYPGPNATQRRGGRIFISPNDIWDIRWRPTGFGVDHADVITFETPVVDVMQYFTAAPSVVPQRSDRTFRYQYLQAPGANGSTWIVIPGFGRKSGFFTFLNRDGAATVTVNVLGVKTSISSDPGTSGSFQKLLDGPHAIAAAGGSATYAFVADTAGQWDMFAIQLQDYLGNAMPITVTLSDKE